MDFKDAPQPITIAGVGQPTPITPFTIQLGVVPVIDSRKFAIAKFDATIGEFRTT